MTMMNGFLGLNALIYGAMALGCWVLPARMASELGLSIRNPCGLSETMAAFGAIPLSFAIVFTSALFRPSDRGPTLRFALLVYGCFLVFRVTAVGMSGWAETGSARVAFLVDAAMFVVAFGLRKAALRVT